MATPRSATPPAPTGPAPSLTLTLTLALIGSLLLAALPASALPRLARKGYEQGQRVEVKGLVTDPEGQPLEDVRVVLELAREVFSFRSLERVEKRVTPVTATTNAKGEYEIVFPWDDYYNSFELAVGVPVRGRSGEELTVLERQDLTRRIEKGSPVVATVVVENASFVRNLREFLASVDSADERRVYEELGRPDRVKVTSYPNRTETAWWYFDAGRVYRFVDGTLRGSETFDPVRGFEE